MPIRIQRKRSRGWKMPEGAVYVGRPTKWGNPVKVGKWLSAEEAVAKYRAWIDSNLWSGPTEFDVRIELRGKNLACWCPLYDNNGMRVPCHADVLLEIANPKEKL